MPAGPPDQDPLCPVLAVFLLLKPIADGGLSALQIRAVTVVAALVWLPVHALPSVTTVLSTWMKHLPKDSTKTLRPLFAHSFNHCLDCHITGPRYGLALKSSTASALLAGAALAFSSLHERGPSVPQCQQHVTGGSNWRKAV